MGRKSPHSQGVGTVQTSEKMQIFIAELCAKHHRTLAGAWSYLRFEKANLMPLIIEKESEKVIKVGQYYQREGENVPDPVVQFFTGYGVWVAISEEHGAPLAGERICAVIGKYGLELLDLPKQAELTEFVNFWAESLRTAQNWLDHSNLALVKETK
jgi:hypothetical protein